MYTQYTSIFKTFNYVDYRPGYSPIIAVFFFNHQQTFRTTECDDVQYPKQAKKMDFSKNKWTPPPLQPFNCYTVMYVPLSLQRGMFASQWYLLSEQECTRY